MRILLTGATGFCGEAVVRRLSEYHELVILGRTQPQYSTGNAMFVRADLADRSSVRKASEAIEGNFEAIVHLAAYVPKSKAEDSLSDAAHANIDGTIHLLEEFTGRYAKLIFGSTLEVHDIARLRGRVTSQSLVGPVSYYASTKLAAEFIARSFCAQHSVPLLILRFSVMYGPDDPIARAIPNFIRSALHDEAIVVRGGRTLRDYIHVEDVAASVEKAIESRSEGIVPIGTGEGVSIEEAAETIIAKSESKSVITREEGEGTDIVVDTQEAKELLDFSATIYFADGITSIVKNRP